LIETLTSRRSGSLIVTVFARTSTVLWAENNTGDVVAIHNSETEPFPFSHIADEPFEDARIGDRISIEMSAINADARKTACELSPAFGVDPASVESHPLPTAAISDTCLSLGSSPPDSYKNSSGHGCGQLTCRSR
jgi:hypothetical protein